MSPSTSPKSTERRLFSASLCLTHYDLYIGWYLLVILSKSLCIFFKATFGVRSPDMASPVCFVKVLVIGLEQGGAGIAPVSGNLSSVL